MTLTFQSYQLSKDPLIPTLLDYLSSSEMLPNFSVMQAIMLEKLLIEHPEIPTPDQVNCYFIQKYLKPKDRFLSKIVFFVKKLNLIIKNIFQISEWSSELGMNYTDMQVN